MLENVKNSKQQGDIGVAIAIATLVEKGYTVLFPLSDNEPYDLAFDDGTSLKKVQVRTTKQKSVNKHGGYVLNLRVCGGNQSYFTSKTFDKTKVDFVFGLTESGSKYLIPSGEIKAMTALILGPSMDKYKV